MTLQGKFKQWLDTNPNEKLRGVQCEIIADDFAIGFARYLAGIFDSGLTVKELLDLLEIYKKEKEL